MLKPASPAEVQARIEAERTGEPFLILRDGDGQQVIFGLGERERVAVGRRAEAELALAWDAEVSRLHAMLERVAGEWTVVDDGLSQNGTFVSDQRVTGRRRLTDGDLVRFGRTQALFRDPAIGERGMTARTDDPVLQARLSDTQRKVLVALCRPLREDPQFATPATNQQIADELFLSVDAVKSHLRALFEKFAVTDVPQNQKRAQLVERAMKSGAVTERELWE